MQPLTGTKVLDLSRLLPGPYVTLVMADLGASIDQIDDPAGGDLLRSVPPYVNGMGSAYHALHRNKRSLSLNLKSSTGRDVLLRLVQSYDVLVESFRPGVLAKWGLSFPDLARVNPRLVVCSVTGYGQSGPLRMKAGHDLNYLARSGFLGLMLGQRDSPNLPGGQVADVGGSLTALVAILAALLERQRTGKGRWLDISMTEASLPFSQMAFSNWNGESVDGLEFPQNPLHGDFPGYQIYRTLDGRHVAVAALEPRFFSRFCEVLNRLDLLSGAYQSQSRREFIRSELEKLFLQYPLSHWVKLFQDEDVCVEPVLSPEEVLQDAHLKDRGSVVVHENNRHVKTPLPFEGVQFVPPSAPGADSEKILSEAGFSKEEISAILSSMKKL